MDNQIDSVNNVKSVERIKLKSKETPQAFVQKTSWHLGIRNGPIARGFWNQNQSIEQQGKNLRFGTLYSIFTQNS